MTFVRKVGKHVALNPVARAIAWNIMRQEALETKIKMLSYADGENISDIIQSLGRFYTMICIAAEEDKIKSKSADHKTMAEHVEVALAQLTVMSENGEKWNAAHVHDQTDAIDYCAELAKEFKPTTVKKAYAATH